MTEFLKRQPALAAAIASLITAAVGLIIKNETLAASLAGVALTFLGLRQVVTPVTTAVENVTRAATDAAVAVARDLDDTVAGTAGTVTGAAERIVDNVVTQTVGNILGGKK